MATFTPVNSLETKLRTLLADRNTPLWSFYTPLAASPLWVIVRHHPELDGSDLVAPPGKKQMPLPMLSGGERAMTAGALILALIEVKPSPFYLLDEVDAAMDDTNVGRFLHAVRELSADSQMVLVTHNKLTMELADVLYGVTMREPGVSSIVSAELTSAPEAAIA